MFRGWSRLCLHAASLSVAERASAAATAAARVAHADAMKTETTAGAEKAEALKSAAAASAEAAASKEQAKRRATELARREEAEDQALRRQRDHRAKRLVRYCRSVRFLSINFVFRGNNLALKTIGRQEEARPMRHSALTLLSTHEDILSCNLYVNCVPPFLQDRPHR